MRKDYLNKSTLLSVYTISVVPFLLLAYLMFSQLQEIKSVEEYALSYNNTNIANSNHLAEVERNIGYVGFIHHFKNYVIRGDINYYGLAQKSHALAMKALQKLKKASTDPEDIAAINIIEQTLTTYYDMLIVARNNIAMLDVQTLDNQIKVSDLAAEQALIILRKNIEIRAQQYQVASNQQINNIYQNTLYIGLIIFPFLLLSTWLILRSFKKLSSFSKELTTIFNASPDAILYMEHNGCILKANSAAYKIFGYENDELRGLKVEMLVDSNIRAKHEKYRTSFTEKEQSREMGDRENKIIGLKKDGTKIELKIAIASKVIDGKKRSVCIVKDITHHKKLEEQAYNDHLTSISNRRHFDAILTKELKRFNREQNPLSLLMIDLDHFKSLNDEFGHTAGDEILIQVAQFLQYHTREYDHLARWGGDEFVILCPNLSAEDALRHAERIRQQFLTINFPWDFDITLSIGVATNFPDKPLSAKSFLEAADKAVYMAKDAGRDQCIHIKDEQNSLVSS